MITLWSYVEGVVALWLVYLTPDRAVWVRDQAGDIVLCVVFLPLSTQVKNGYQ